jgi:hypothetical protein
MPERETPSFMAATPIKPGREADFESFVRAVIAPAAQQARPDLLGMVELLRPATQPPEGATSAYMFVFYGDAPLDDWYLPAILTSVYGEEEGNRLHEQFHDFLVDGSQTIYCFADAMPLPRTAT